MANQLKMATVQSILHLHSLRWSQRRIAAELQVDRETVSRYLRLSRESAPTVQADPNPAIAPISSPALDSSNPAIAPIPGPGAAALSSPAKAPISAAGRGSDCAGWRELIEAKQAQGLSARRIHHDLVTEHGAAVIRACNLLPEVMMVPMPAPKRVQQTQWRPIRAIDRQPFEGDVYSMDVERWGHYIADGMVTHNCFYGWREGAAHQFLGPNNAVDVWSIKKINPQSMVHLMRNLSNWLRERCSTRPRPARTCSISLVARARR